MLNAKRERAGTAEASRVEVSPAHEALLTDGMPSYLTMKLEGNYAWSNCADIEPLTGLSKFTGRAGV